MLRKAIFLIAAAGLILCLLSPAFYFLGQIKMDQYKSLLLAGTVIWFLCAAFLTSGKKGGSAP